jgi:hypothetical protein
LSVRKQSIKGEKAELARIAYLKGLNLNSFRSVIEVLRDNYIDNHPIIEATFIQRQYRRFLQCLNSFECRGPLCLTKTSAIDTNDITHRRMPRNNLDTEKKKKIKIKKPSFGAE